MKYIGYLTVTPEGLEEMAKWMRKLETRRLSLSAYATTDATPEVKLCVSKDAGWIELGGGK